MKRSSSESPEHTPSPPTSTQSTPKKQKKKKTNDKPSTPSNEDVKPGVTRTSPGEWTAEKKGDLIEHLLVLGLSQISLNKLAQKYDLNKEQVKSALKGGKKMSLRQRVVAFAKST